jgi:DNA-binding HxlR family transcriptional regulator
VSQASTSPQEDNPQTIEACPVVRTLDAVGTPWRLQIMYALRDDELRFNELKRATGGRSKTISDALDVLDDHGLVTRRTEVAAPIAVYYGLTQKGETLLAHFDDVSEWAVEWMDGVEDPNEFTRRLR